MVKQIITIISVFAIITTISISANSAQSDFSDVPPSNPFYIYINSLRDAGIVSGYSDGTFKPDDGVTRAEMAKFAVKAFNIPINTSCGYFQDFNDPNNGLVPYATTLKCEGIVSGTSNGYLPNNLITRGEAMAVIMRSAQLVKPGVFYNLFYKQYFSDVPTTSGFYEHIMKAFSHNIVSGQGTTFGVSRSVTRGEMSKIIDNARALENNLKTDLVTSREGTNLYQVGDHLVQVLDMRLGTLEIKHGSIANYNVGQGFYGNNNPTFNSRNISTFWSTYRAQYPKAFSVYNAAFFRGTTNPTQTAFAIKKDNQILTDGYAGGSEFKNQKKVLKIWNNENRVDIVDFNESLTNSVILNQIDSPDGIVSLSTNANKSKDSKVGRTLLGVADKTGDNYNETVIIFVTEKATQAFGVQVLKDFGSEKEIMFDGGGSSQVEHLSIDTGRKIPVVLLTTHN
jgi:hypothetical protein